MSAQTVLTFDILLSFRRLKRSDGLLSLHLADDGDNLLKRVVLLENQALGLANGGQTFLMLVISNGRTDDSLRLLRIVQWNRNERLGRQHLADVRVAGIKRQTLAQERVGDLLPSLPLENLKIAFPSKPACVFRLRAS